MKKCRACSSRTVHPPVPLPEAAADSYELPAHLQAELDEQRAREALMEREAGQRLERARAELVEHGLPADLEYLGAGRHRLVFRSGDIVIKVPGDGATGYGLASNDREARTCSVAAAQSDPGWLLGLHYPKCRLLPPDDRLLEMEYVKPARLRDGPLPDWTGYVDCQQVGYNKDGKLLAYDFGY